MSQASSGTSATSKSHVALPYGAWRCRMVPLGVARWPLALPDSGALPAGMGRARRPLASSCRISACDLALPGGPGVAGWRSPCPPPPKNSRTGARSGARKGCILCCKCGCKIRLVTLRDVSIVVTNRVGQRCKFRKSSQPQIGSWRSEPFQLRRAGRVMHSCIPCASFPTSPFSMVVANVPRGSFGPRG